MTYTKKFTVTLPMPPSVNGLFAGKVRRFKSKKYKEWEAIAMVVFSQQYSGEEINPDAWLHTRYILHTPLYYKNGNRKKIDCANYEKATSDFLAGVLPGFEDMMIVKNTQEKRESDRNEVECIITEADE